MRHVRREARRMKLPALAPCRAHCDRLHAAANEFDISVHSSHAKRISVEWIPIAWRRRKKHGSPGFAESTSRNSRISYLSFLLHPA
jgi:hypothetical protein